MRISSLVYVGLGLLLVSSIGLFAQRKMQKGQRLGAASLGDVPVPFTDIDMNEVDRALETILPGGVGIATHSYVPTDSALLVQYLQKGVEKQWLVDSKSSVDVDALAQDILSCKDSKDGVGMIHVLSRLVDKENIFDLPVMDYKYIGLVFRCPNTDNKDFRMGVVSMEHDLMMRYPVSEEDERICLEIKDKIQQSDCFQSRHVPDMKHSEKRLTEVKKFLIQFAYNRNHMTIESILRLD